MKRLAALAAATVACLACGGEPDDPESRVRALVDRAEAAAEDRDVGDVVALLSERFRDSYGGDRDTVKALLAHLFLRNDAIHLLVRVHDIDFRETGGASLRASVAMAGTPIPELTPDAGALLDLRADLHRFDLELEEERGEWRVIHAAWRKAELADFAP